MGQRTRRDRVGGDKSITSNDKEPGARERGRRGKGERNWSKKVGIPRSEGVLDSDRLRKGQTKGT